MARWGESVVGVGLGVGQAVDVGGRRSAPCLPNRSLNASSTTPLEATLPLARIAEWRLLSKGQGHR